MTMAKVKELKLNDEVALAGHTHTAGEVSYDSGSSYAGGTVGAELKTLGSSKVSTIDHDASINVSTASPNSTTNPKISVNISTESDNGLQLKGSTESHPGLYVSKETLGLSTAYIPKGSITVAAANTGDSASTPSTAWGEGWVYNMSDSGTLANGIAGPVAVETGDNIVRVKDATDKYRWDKLSATINASYSGGDGIHVDETNRSIAVDLGNNSGLKIDDSGKLVINASDGLYVDGSSGLRVKRGAGLTVNGTGDLKVAAGNGLGFDSNNNLVVTGTGAIDVGSSGVYLRTADGLEVNNNNDLTVKTGDGIGIVDNRVVIRLKTDNSGLLLAGSTDAAGVGIALADSNPGLSIDSTGIKVNGANGIAVSGSSVVLNRRTTTSGSNTVDNSGLAISANAVYVNAGAGLELSGSTDTAPGSVRVRLSATNGRQNINNNDGTYVSLDRAFNVNGSTGETLDGTYNPTIGEILAALGATMASAS